MEPKPIVELHNHILGILLFNSYDYINDTVKPAYNGHPWEMARCLLYIGWPIYTGQLCRKYNAIENLGEVVRWPQYTWWPLYTKPSYTGLTVFLAKAICCLSPKFNDKIFCLSQTFLTSDNHLRDAENIRKVLCKSFIQWFWELNCILISTKSTVLIRSAKGYSFVAVEVCWSESLEI